jgi:predicted anti-sigma-YlaC factor YlaD
MPVPLTCPEVRKRLPAYLLDVLSPALNARILAHLAECPGCQAVEDRGRVALDTRGTLGPTLPEG